MLESLRELTGAKCIKIIQLFRELCICRMEHTCKESEIASFDKSECE